MSDYYSDQHKRAMNFIYQKPLYPEVWEESEGNRNGEEDQRPRENQDGEAQVRVEDSSTTLQIP